MERTRQAYRERDTVPLIENLLQDLRFAFRQLVKNPGFAVTAIVILTLGIAASAALFAFVDAALLKPLPYRSRTDWLPCTRALPQFRAFQSFVSGLSGLEADEQIIPVAGGLVRHRLCAAHARR